MVMMMVVVMVEMVVVMMLLLTFPSVFVYSHLCSQSVKSAGQFAMFLFSLD